MRALSKFVSFLACIFFVGCTGHDPVSTTSDGPFFTSETSTDNSVTTPPDELGPVFECPTWATYACSVEMDSGTGLQTVRIRDLKANAPEGSIVAFDIPTRVAVVFLENIDLSGFFVVLDWTPQYCNECARLLHVDNVTLRAPPVIPEVCIDHRPECPSATGEPLGLYAGINQDRNTTTSIQNLRTIGYRSVIGVSGPLAVTKMVVSNGSFSGTSTEADVEFTALAIEASNCNSGVQAHASTRGGTVRLHGIIVNGTCPTGIFATGMAVLANNLTVKELDVGFEVEAEHLEVIDSTFIGNGHGAYRFFSGGIRLKALARIENQPSLGDDSSVVHNSVFRGNSYGIYSEVTVNASDNYWGDPMGPRVWVDALAAPPPQPGNGDYVNENVIFVPWKRVP
jgi:hypothetical protein